MKNFYLLKDWFHKQDKRKKMITIFIFMVVGLMLLDWVFYK